MLPARSDSLRHALPAGAAPGPPDGWFRLPAGWRGAAACQGADPRLFDPPAAHEHAAQWASRLVAARAVCCRCPVITARLLEAGLAGEVGVRGGFVLHAPHRGRRLPADGPGDRRLSPPGRRPAPDRARPGRVAAPAGVS